MPHAPSDTSFVDVLRRRAQHQPDRRIFTFLEDGEQETSAWSFAELDRRARAIAVLLRARCAPGERALLLYPFGLDFVAAFFGALYAGVVAVPVYPPDPARLNRTLPRLQAIARDAQARLVLTTSMVQQWASELADQAPDLASLRWVATDETAAGAAEDWRPPDVNSDTIAFLQYTSGSTSQPKGVLVTHGNLLHNAAVIQQAFGSTSRSVGVTWLPLYHDMGLIGGVLQPIYAGFHTVLIPPETFLQQPLRWPRAVSHYGATISGGPNFAYELCARRMARSQGEKLDLRNWNCAFNGAEPVRGATLERFTRAFSPHGFDRDAFHVCYGLAESTLMATGQPPLPRTMWRTLDASALKRGNVIERQEGAPDSRRMVSVGQPMLGTEVAIVDPVTRLRRAPDQVGEIWLSGPSVTQGYWNQPEATETTFRAVLADSSPGTWLRTGDLGFMANGQLYVVGRSKDLIIIRGVNHAPQDIERTIEECHPALRPGCGAAFALDSLEEERLVIVHELRREHEDSDLETLARHMRQSVAEAHDLKVDTLVLVRAGSIPKTSSGKIQRGACRQEFLSDALDILHLDRLAARESRGVGATSSRSEDRATFLREQVARMLGVDAAQVDPSLPLWELGLDSLQQTELKQLLQERFEASEHAESPGRAEPSTFAIAWDVTRDAPELWRYLSQAEPWVIAELERMRHDLPVPPTQGVFDAPTAFRPEGHFRAFYRRGPGESVLAIKGADVRCEDQSGFLLLMQQRLFERHARHSVTSALEYFLIQERKVPGAVTLPEALTEAARAAELQERFVKEYGAPGGMPVPLLVARWSPEVIAAFRARLLPLLSGFTLEIAEEELRDGLACYVYWFPKAPHPRVSHFAGTLAQESQRTGSGGFTNTRLIYSTLKHNLDPEAVVESWVRLIARMLLLGYFPSDIQHFKNGQCIEPQNMLLNGCLADLDSVVPMSRLGSDREFYASFFAMLNLLANTLRVFLAAEANGTTMQAPPFPQQFQRPDFLEMLSVIHLWERLKVQLREQRPGPHVTLDPRLEELFTSELSFPVLFEKVLFPLYYAGPTLPESAVGLLSVADVYSDSTGNEQRVRRKVDYSAKLSVDSVALATLPRAFLDQLQLTSREFVHECLHDKASLVTVYETFLGRIGLVVLPLEDATLFTAPDRTVKAVVEGLEEGSRLGADTASLLGMVPSATDYGRAIERATAGRAHLPHLTTGHGTTAACFVMMVEQVMRVAGRKMADEDVALLGVGSIGTSILRLLVDKLPHPRLLRLCDVPAKREHLERLQHELRTVHGFRGRIELTLVPATSAPDEVYEASCILCATNVARLLDVERIRPGTLVVDDSAPHCFDPRHAIRRFQEKRDVLFTEAGALRSHRPVGEMGDITFATGWDHKVRAALKLLHPREDTLMGCVFSSILSSRFEDAPCLVGTPRPRDLDLHYRKLRELDFEAARPYLEDYLLDETLVGLFRERFGASA